MLHRSLIATLTVLATFAAADLLAYDFIQGYNADGYDAGSSWISGGNIRYDGADYTPGTPKTCFAKCLTLNCGAVVMSFPSGFNPDDGGGNDITTYCNYYSLPIPASVFASQTPLNQPYTGGAWQAVFNLRSTYWIPSVTGLPVTAGACNADGCLTSCAPQSSFGGAIGGAQCIPCDDMTYAGWNNQQSTCSACNSMTQCKPSGVATSCKSGFALSSTGICTVCPDGLISSDGNTSDCSAPPPPPSPSISPSESPSPSTSTPSPTATTCSAGKYLVSPGRCESCMYPGVNTCGPKTWAATTCIPGYGRPLGWTCHACNPGTFSSSFTSKACTHCDANTYASGIGSTKCNACAKGTYSTTGSSQCLLKADLIACKSGSQRTVMDNVPLCTSCGTGVRFCTGTLNSRQTIARICEKNYYLANIKNVLVCRPGTKK